MKKMKRDKNGQLRRTDGIIFQEVVVTKLGVSNNITSSM